MSEQIQQETNAIEIKKSKNPQSLSEQAMGTGPDLICVNGKYRKCDLQTDEGRFEYELLGTARPGIENLFNWLKTKSDFFTAPASTKYHLSCRGGLLKHSLNVYDCLKAKKHNPIWEKALENISDDSLAICALLHDICKTNFYNQTTKNQKTYDAAKVAAAESWKVKHDNNGDFIWETVDAYEIDEKTPLGHGEKSVIIAQFFIKMNIDEILAIRWHMGYSEEKSNYNAIGKAMEQHPLVLALHEADLEATKLLEADN